MIVQQIVELLYVILNAHCMIKEYTHNGSLNHITVIMMSDSESQPREIEIKCIHSKMQ